MTVVHVPVLIVLPALLLCAAGCAALTEPDPVVLALPEENPFAKPGRCGLNALYKVLRHHDAAVAAERIGRLAPERDEGLADFELAGIARRLGFSCTFGPSTPEDLARHVRNGRPAMVLIPGTGRAHWVVVHGYDPRGALWVDFCRTGETAELAVSVFDRLWKRHGRRAVIVTGRKPEPNNTTNEVTP